MIETQREPNIRKACQAPNRLADLQTISTGLEKCQKSLNDYLDSKRNAFPRFFFISDDELLSILGSSDPACVQEHIIKMFDNISSLRLIKGTDNITIAHAMISAEKEKIKFITTNRLKIIKLYTMKIINNWALSGAYFK